ncbi:MAG: molybdopterin molybdotransferase MoeA [Planctomycetes bacterium]|nr:molybdopterin molybdotransferase MoeA [Planctomycetota bacterium]
MAKALSLLDARAVVLQRSRLAPATEVVGLAEAHGRVLAEAIVADGPWPATDRSAMDGFALAASSRGLAAGTTLPVVGASLAGAPFAGALPAAAAIRIMTGAVVPAGADTVVPVERTSGFAGDRVTLQADVAAGQNIRPRGSELAAGAVVLPAGTRLRAAAIGVLAVLGRVRTAVARQPVVAIVATGDEVVPAEAVPLPHQVRESNSWALAAQVRECGAIARRLPIAPDEPAALRALLQDALASADVVLTIGGVSQGTHDLVHGTLQELGVEPVFHGLDLKPGKPTFFGVRAAPRGARFVFGLPGNPASTFTVFDLLVQPLLRQLQGEPVAGELPVALPGGAPWTPNARLQALPARFVADAGGALRAELAAPSPSGDPFRLVHADGYVLVAGQQRPVEVATLPFVLGTAGARLS